jgi:pimeloyl-ACP methyl ester carboxylesterase
MIQVNGINIWTETFGDKKNPALVLFSGAGGQGIKWPTFFCETLANEGYFVIRFDNRDTGLSSSINFDAAPYTLLDMANDVIGILDHYQLQTAHIAGSSMGGAIAMLLGAHYPDRVSSLNLLITTIDFRPGCDLFQGLQNTYSLPAPSMKVIEAIKKSVSTPPRNLEEKIQQYIDGMKLHCGSFDPDEELMRELTMLSLERMQYPETQNHFRAMVASYDIHAAAPEKITAPTHIVHGDEDLIFPLEHGKAIQAAIAGSTLSIIPGLGHNLANRKLLPIIIENILMNIKNTEA